MLLPYSSLSQSSSSNGKTLLTLALPPTTPIISPPSAPPILALLILALNAPARPPSASASTLAHLTLSLLLASPSAGIKSTGTLAFNTSVNHSGCSSSHLAQFKATHILISPSIETQ
jgi:hypothetical protein